MSEKPKITFNYHFSENYNPVYVKGAYGGIGPKGELIVNFFLERQGIPKSHTHEINKDGSLNAEPESVPKDPLTNVIRFIQTGIILNMDSAKHIHDWLEQKIDDLQNLTKLNVDENSDKNNKEEE